MIPGTMLGRVTDYVHNAENALDTGVHTAPSSRAGLSGEADPSPGQPACDGCPAAMARYEATGDAVVCVCGRVYAADDFRWPARPVAPPTSPRSARIVRPRSFVAPDDAATSARRKIDGGGVPGCARIVAQCGA